MNDTPKPIRVRASDGAWVVGSMWTAPTPRATVLLSHGITVDRHEHLLLFDHLALHLLTAGFNVVSFDHRGHGHRKQSQLTLIGQLLDIAAVVERLLPRTAPGLDVHLVGCSFGAPPVLWAATRFPIVRSSYLIAPVLDYVQTFLEPRTRWAADSFSETALADLPRRGSLLLDRHFVISRHLVLEMERFSRPALLLPALGSSVRIIHGDEDSMVPADITKAAVAGTSVELLSVPGMDHGFVAAGDESGDSMETCRFRDQLTSDLVHFLDGTRR